MNLTLTFSFLIIEKIRQAMSKWPWMRIAFVISVIASVASIIQAYMTNTIIAYSDAESHLNIAKRVVSGLTPGIAQLGGVWLPLPHLLMTPFVYFDPLWKTGLAGSIVSGICFIVASLFIYKLTYLLTKSKLASMASFFVFVLNPNILYMQSTPMTELPLIAFFVLSAYFFVKYLKEDKENNEYLQLILSGFFAFCAALSRYDGWFLVGIEALVIVLDGYRRKTFKEIEGRVIIFSTLAFFGIALWILWDGLILGDPLFFSHSQFSANAQQRGWLAKGELPAYKNIVSSFAYYTVTSMTEIGIILFAITVIGFIVFLKNKENKKRLPIALLMLVPFFFYVITLYLGQSVIFIPQLTPVGFEWRLFNVRYGIMMVPFAALFCGYLFFKSKPAVKVLLVFLFLAQFGLYFVGYSKVMALADATEGLSQQKSPDAQMWLAKHYDNGYVLLDDYNRIISLIGSNIPMQNVIYVGSKPYWDEALQAPEKYAKWVIIQRDDAIWNAIYAKPVMRGQLYKYYYKVYTSPLILIFERVRTN